MSPTLYVVIGVFAVIISALIFLIIKTVLVPKKVDAVPKLLKQGKTQAAIKLAKTIIAKDPKNYTAHYYLGKSYLAENKSELAGLEYKLVNENALFGNGIDELTFRKEYAGLLVKQNQQNEALKNLLLLTRLEPNNGDHYFNAGSIYEAAGRYDTALGFMQKAIKLSPKNAKAHAEMGLMYYRMKNFPEARKEIDTALKLSPDFYTSYYYLGKIQKDAKDYSSAVKSFEKAQRDPEIKQKAIIEHGSCYLMAGRYDNAIVDFQRAIELDKTNMAPETLYARYFLASCYEKGHKIEKAIEQWDAIYKRNKGFRDVAAKLAEYKDLHLNDSLKDYLTCSNEEFTQLCKLTAEKALKMQCLTCELKKFGCQITAIEKSSDSWKSVRKQVLYIRFYRETDPLEDSVIRDTLDALKPTGSVKGYIFSSSGFTNTAKAYAENRPVELGDKTKLEAILAAATGK